MALTTDSLRLKYGSREIIKISGGLREARITHLKRRYLYTYAYMSIHTLPRHTYTHCVKMMANQKNGRNVERPSHNKNV